MNEDDLHLASTSALRLFQAGQEEAAKRGLLLVDTKYEFGKDADGNVVVVDEVHTPDSSRYWLADSYHDRLAAGQVLDATSLPVLAT
jgi:phosphoribosylaminoimidazole-succinocarboxamide synthase